MNCLCYHINKYLGQALGRGAFDAQVDLHKDPCCEFLMQSPLLTAFDAQDEDGQTPLFWLENPDSEDGYFPECVSELRRLMEVSDEDVARCSVLPCSPA